MHRAMPIAIVTGSGGLIGSESVRHFAERGYDVVGIENDMRARFFGAEASTRRTSPSVLQERLPDEFRTRSSTSATPTASSASSPSTPATSS